MKYLDHLHKKRRLNLKMIKNKNIKYKGNATNRNAQYKKIACAVLYQAMLDIISKEKKLNSSIDKAQAKNFLLGVSDYNKWIQFWCMIAEIPEEKMKNFVYKIENKNITEYEIKKILEIANY